MENVNQVTLDDTALDQALRDGYFALAHVIGSRMHQTAHQIASTIFEAVWAPDTAKPTRRNDWSNRNKSCGQDDVSSLAFQTMRGGRIYSTPVAEYGPHFYNMTVNGEGLSNHDLTKSQYTSETHVYVHGQSDVEREEILSDPEILVRYRILRGRLLDVINKELGFANTPDPEYQGDPS